MRIKPKVVHENEGRIISRYNLRMFRNLDFFYKFIQQIKDIEKNPIILVLCCNSMGPKEIKYITKAQLTNIHTIELRISYAI